MQLRAHHFPSGTSIPPRLYCQRLRRYTKLSLVILSRVPTLVDESHSLQSSRQRGQLSIAPDVQHLNISHSITRWPPQAHRKPLPLQRLERPPRRTGRPMWERGLGQGHGHPPRAQDVSDEHPYDFWNQVRRRACGMPPAPYLLKPQTLWKYDAVITRTKDGMERFRGSTVRQAYLSSPKYLQHRRRPLGA